MKIGIYGGSFDPLHLGHLKLAREAASELNLDRLYLVPANRNPLKDGEAMMPAPLRLRLAKKASRGTGFLVSDCDLRRKGKSYAVDTVAHFRRRHPGAVLYFLSGTDAGAELMRWKDWRRLMRECRFTVLTRPGRKKIDRSLPVWHLALDALPFSSSQVRRRLRAGRSVKGMVPRAIEKELKRHYQTEGKPHRNRTED